MEIIFIQATASFLHDLSFLGVNLLSREGKSQTGFILKMMSGDLSFPILSSLVVAARADKDERVPVTAEPLTDETRDDRKKVIIER